jgi:hypothetical protein
MAPKAPKAPAPAGSAKSGGKGGKGKAAAGPLALWLAPDPSKRWFEVFILAYSPFWICWALCVLVPFRLYEVQGAGGACMRGGGGGGVHMLRTENQT